MNIVDFLGQKGIDQKLSVEFEKLCQVILEWNEKINVTAIRDPEEFMAKNIMDSLTLCGTPQLENAQTVIDIGTGGGFPGLPLAIVYPDKKFVLNDTIGKKLKVVEAAANVLGLKNVTVLHGRAEDLARMAEYRDAFDLSVSRAVANMSTLCEYCIPFVKKGGYFIAYKTEAASEEISSAKSAVEKLAAEMKPFILDGIEGSGHGFVMIEKKGSTPKAYPRKAGTPLKEPLK